MKGNLFSKTLGLSLAIALVLTPVVNLAVVRDNVGGMDTSVSQEGNTPNGGATSDQILEGYGAYVDGVLVEGNIPTANVTDTTINNLNDTVTIPGHTYIDEDLTIGLSSTFLKDATSGATATANKMLQGETAYVNGELITGTIPSLAAKTYTPGTTNQTIASGKYLSGTQTISGDADLKSSNIKSGVNIFGVAGNSNVVDTSAGTATAAQILKDKIAFVDGNKVTGSFNLQEIINSINAKASTNLTVNSTAQEIANAISNMSIVTESTFSSRLLSSNSSSATVSWSGTAPSGTKSNYVTKTIHTNNTDKIQWIAISTSNHASRSSVFSDNSAKTSSGTNLNISGGISKIMPGDSIVLTIGAATNNNGDDYSGTITTTWNLYIYNE